MNIKPLGERVVIRPVAAETKTIGGIVIPDTAKEKPQEGEVVAVGPGRVTEAGNLVPMTVKVGDKVLFSKYAAMETKLENEEFVIVFERDIIALM